MKITSTQIEYEKDLLEVARLFYPKYSLQEEEVTIIHSHEQKDENNFLHTFTICDSNGTYTHNKQENKQQNPPLTTRKLLQTGLYEALTKHTKQTMPWGCLVGIRPVKAMLDLKNLELSSLGAINYFKNVYYVSEQKCNLVQQVIEMQGHQTKNEKLINLYIHIPFCVSRCSYCSFMSSQIGTNRQLIASYVNALVDEIKHTKQFLQKNSYIVKNIYVGGGTPTAFEVSELEPVLQELAPYNVKEFTVEAGRVDTITKEKLDLFKKYNVTRISINPQSFNESVLKKANRNHTVKQFLEVYKMALPYNFTVNMDLIVGLEGETQKSFEMGLNTLLELAPDNITIHTLSLKRASVINQTKTNIAKLSVAQKMLDYACKKLNEAGYVPYYMYRQKNMLENLENIGFCKDKKVCQFNVDSIDEYASILACGAGGASKRIYFTNNKKEQVFNVKGVEEYISRIEEMKKRKDELFS
ncbi:MAG: coproporphyrinogen dehydrogenase HemZ [Tenericutes bacterium HGW-Tenericutes-4]|jgi:oxygen-independent coproporphyrinogen-3 oxidase|nr:MAG: coproporphyrinogen dehydrogenase HemZ [Tenericutes bacterium HGW-Tenericutes-4]